MKETGIYFKVLPENALLSIVQNINIYSGSFYDMIKSVEINPQHVNISHQVLIAG